MYVSTRASTAGDRLSRVPRRTRRRRWAPSLALGVAGVLDALPKRRR
jgi:hypothetical protein